MYNIEPQLILIFNNDGKIIKTMFLSYYDIINTKIYKFFQNVVAKQFDIKNYEIVKNHILLSLTLNEAKGYIREKILKTRNPILLFSLFNNLEFEGTTTEKIFNPFKKSSYGERINSTSVLYSIYNNISRLGIFCVLENDETNDYFTYGEYDEDVFLFVDTVMTTIQNETNYELDFETSIKGNEELFLDTTDDDFISQIQSDNSNIAIVKNINNEYYVSGEKLIYYPTKHKYVTMLFFDEDEKIIGLLINGRLQIIDLNSTFSQNITMNSLNNYLLNKNIIFKKVSINMNISMTQLYLPLNKYPFFLSYNITNRNNILFDRSKKINIIITKKKIDFISTLIRDTTLYIYLTFWIIGIQIINKKIEFISKNVKKGLIYFSRYCQAKRNPERSNILSNDFIKTLRVLNKDIYQDIDGHQCYIKDRVLYTCKDDTFKYIGFVKSILNGWGICLPCCYKKLKYDSSSFAFCIHNQSIEIAIDPYLGDSKQYKLLIDSTQIGNLSGELNELFNKNAHFIKTVRYLTKRNKEIETFIENYVKSTKSTTSQPTIKTTNQTTNQTNNSIVIKYNHYKDQSIIQLRDDGFFTTLNKSKEQEPQTAINILKDKYEKLSIFDAFILLNLRGRIELAKNYVVYVANFTLKDINNNLDIDDNNIYLIKEEICFSNILREKYITGQISIDDIDIYLVIQKKIHELRIINKTPNEPIKLNRLTGEFKRKLIIDLLSIRPCKFEIKKGDFTLKDNFFFYKNKFLDMKINTKYFLKFDQVTFDQLTIGNFLSNYYSKYFDTIVTQEEGTKNFQCTWFANLSLMLNNFDLNVLGNIFLNNEKNIEYFRDTLLSVFNDFYLIQDKDIVNF